MLQGIHTHRCGLSYDPSLNDRATMTLFNNKVVCRQLGTDGMAIVASRSRKNKLVPFWGTSECRWLRHCFDMGVILGIQCSVIHVGHCTDGQIPLLCSYIFDQNQAPTSWKTPPSPHRLFDLQDSLDKLMHFLPQLTYFVPLRNRFYSFRAQTA